MSERILETMRDIIQRDVGQRGLATDPVDNLLTAYPGDFAAACRSIAATKAPHLAIVTGFFIPQGEPPCGETDGPLGALFLARGLTAAGMRATLVTDGFCTRALQAGLNEAGLARQIPLITLPDKATPRYQEDFLAQVPGLTHLIALERVGPTHTAASIRQQPGSTEAIALEFERELPPRHQDRCHTMRGRDITEIMSPAHLLFEPPPAQRSWTTLGIGDGGNEIGMGRIAWKTIHKNIPGGGLVACRVPTDQLIVCGISNWGAYALAAGVLHLRRQQPVADLFSLDRERALLQRMVEEGPLVDGVRGRPSLSVDGLDFEDYAAPLRELERLVAQGEE